MSQDLPYIGVSLSPQVKPNTDWYLRSLTKSNTNTPTTTAPTSLSYDLSGRTYGFTTRRGRTYELGRVESGEAQLAVDNTDGLLDPLNNLSALYPNVVPYRPVSIHCAYPRTGNILNDSNLVPAWDANAPTPLSASRISVGQNDGDFELGAIGNWYAISGTAPTTTATAHSGSYAMSCANGSNVLLDVPVVSGQQVTVSIWYRFSGATTTGTLKVYDGGWINTAASATATTNLPNTTTYTRVSATYTTTSTKLTIGVANSGGAAALYVDDVQVEFGATATSNVTTGPAVYHLFNGFIERYPQTFQAPNRGQANLVATDAMASMTQNNLPSVYASQVLQSGALYYYPMSDSSGSTGAYNNSAYQQDPMIAYQWKQGKAAVFGDTSAQSGVPGSGTTGVTLFADADGSATKGYTSLQNTTATDLVIKNQGDAYIISFWFKPNDSMPGTYTIFSASPTPINPVGVSGSSTSPSPSIAVRINGTTGQLNLAISDGKGTTTNTNTSANSVSGWGYVSVAVGYSSTAGGSLQASMTYQTGTYTSYATGNISIAWTVSEFDLSTISLIGAGSTTGSTYSSLAIQRTSVSGTTWANWSPSSYYTLGANGLNGDSTGERFGDITNTYSGFTYQPTDAQFGYSFMQAASTSGTSMGDYLQTITDTEGGSWYVDGDGYAVFKDRHDRLKKLTPTVTFGNSAGETPYQGGDLVINYDPTYVLNDITVSRLNGTTVAVQDSTSVAYYFPRSYTRQSQSQADSDVTDQAFFLLDRYKDPHARPETITLTPARNPSVWPVALNMEVGDLVRVNKEPLGAPPISIDCFVERIEHSFDAQSGEWLTNVTMSPTIVYYWGLAPVRATTTGAAVSGSYVFTKASDTTGGGLVTPRDIIPGQMLQYTASGTTYVDVVSGIPTETSTTITVPATRIGTITSGANTVYSSKLANDIIPDATYSAGIIALSDGNLYNKGLTTFLIDEEIITGAVTLTGSTYYLTVNSRAQSGTIQTMQGMDYDSLFLVTRTESHLTGATVYGVTATAGGNVPTGTVVYGLLPNQTVRLPYTVPVGTSWDNSSTLGSWTSTLASATISLTTPASAIKYGTVTFAALTDRDNYPAQDLATGQMVTLYNGSAAESVAFAQFNVPSSTTGAWTGAVYKVTDSTRTLNTAVGPDTTTISCSGTVTASAILIGMEFMQVTAGSGTSTLTVTRGTPDAAVWSVLSKAPHYQYDKIYTVVNAGPTGTYAVGNAVIEGYNVTTPVVGTARLAF